MSNPDPSAARAAKAANAAQRDVPILSVEDVESLKEQLASDRAELTRMRAEKEAAEAKLNQFTGVTFGLPQPQPADPYVSSAEYNIPGLNDTNAMDVIAGAEFAGKPSWKTSRITHKQSAPQITQGRAGTFWFYDEGGYARRLPNQSIGAALAAGLWPVCPICKGYHPESETNPNACPKRPKVAKTRCKICLANGATRWIYDVVEKPVLDKFGNPVVLEDDADDDLIETQVDIPSTPQARLTMRLEQHIRVYHKSAAASMRLQAQDD